MPLYVPFGRTLVTYGELEEKAASGELARFMEAARDDRSSDITFEAGVVESSVLATAFGLASGPIQFGRVGANRPLTVEIERVYTGEHKRRDMLVTSAIKSDLTFDAQPRAVNMLIADVGSNEEFESVPAVEKGTFVVHYTPAVLHHSLNLHIDFSFDDVRDELFQVTGDLFKSAAGVPIFAPYQGILVAAGLVVRLIGKIANAVVDRRPEFRDSATLRIADPGYSIPDPGFRVMVPKDFGVDELKNYSYETGRLVDKAGRAYAGRYPYVVFSLNGDQNDRLKEFGPTAASAALLEQFMNVSEGKSVVAGALLDALKLVNDVKFMRQAEALKARIATSTDSEKPKLTDEFNALVASILNDDLKPQLKQGLKRTGIVGDRVC